MLFTRAPVSFLSLDNISFARPVSIGSILRLKSYILHTASTAEYPALIVSDSFFDLPSFTDCMCAARGCKGQRRRRTDWQGAVDKRLPLHMVSRRRREPRPHGCAHDLRRCALNFRVEVVPRSDTPITEAMWWVEGRRALELGAEIRQLRHDKRDSKI